LVWRTTDGLTISNTILERAGSKGNGKKTTVGQPSLEEGKENGGRGKGVRVIISGSWHTDKNWGVWHIFTRNKILNKRKTSKPPVDLTWGALYEKQMRAPPLNDPGAKAKRMKKKGDKNPTARGN